MRATSTRIVFWLAASTMLYIGGCAHTGSVAPGAGVVPAAPLVVWVASPHFRSGANGPRSPGDVDAIVIHTTEGNYDDEASFADNQARIYEGTIRYFQKNDREVSAHYLIGPGGEVTQMVRGTDIAHTQTYYNGRSLGIECAGWSDRPGTWTPELLDALARLVAHLAATWDLPLEHPAGSADVGPHCVETADGNRFDGSGIVGHYQIQPWNRTDPGPHFPWESFMDRVRLLAGE